MRILTVGDGRPKGKTLADILSVKGFRAEAGRFATEALERTAEGRFDCVPTDIKMPEVDGVVLLRTIRATRPCLPLVFMTASPIGAWSTKRWRKALQGPLSRLLTSNSCSAFSPS